MALALALTATACQSDIPSEALQWRPESLERRQLQTRRFDTENEAELLSACSGVLQDLGFNITESHAPLGLIVGQKERDASEVKQVVGSTAVFIVTLALGAPVWIPTDKDQTIRVSIVTRPFDAERKSTAARVTFQRVVRNSENRISKIEGIEDAKIYQEFFERLSKAVFLEAQQI